MKSHQYEFRLADVAGLLGGLLVPMVIFAAVMRVGVLCNLFPDPWPALGVDQTIFTHQAETSRTVGDADVVFIGDSSCLMDFSGAEMERIFAGKHHALNLGTFMYTGFNGYSALLSRYLSVNPGRVKCVVVLLHPEMLRGAEALPQYLTFLSSYYARTDLSGPDSVLGNLRGLFGLQIFEDRFRSRTPVPLPKAYGRYYGFNLDLYRFMDDHRGSLVDPHEFASLPGQGNAEYRLAASLEAGCMGLRATVPPSAKVVLGLTPIPLSFAPPGYQARWLEMASQCGEWLRADAVLTNLPATLWDSHFASTTHLNQAGARNYATILARCLQPYLD